MLEKILNRLKRDDKKIEDGWGADSDWMFKCMPKLVKQAQHSLKLEEAIERGLDDYRNGIAMDGEDLEKALKDEK